MMLDDVEFGIGDSKTLTSLQQLDLQLHTCIHVSVNLAGVVVVL